MIGEIRDTPSASLALQAAMTGHQVWTTLHANNSIAIVDRLIDLGVPAEILCDPAIVSGLVSQRLVKTLCPHCKVSLKNAIGSLSIREEYERIAKYIDLESVYIKGEGCDKCSGSGLLGRTVVSEVILPDNKIMEFLRARNKSSAIDYWMRSAGGKTMLMDAVDKVNAGLCDPFLVEDVVGPIDFLGQLFAI